MLIMSYHQLYFPLSITWTREYMTFFKQIIPELLDATDFSYILVSHTHSWIKDRARKRQYFIVSHNLCCPL